MTRTSVFAQTFWLIIAVLLTAMSLGFAIALLSPPPAAGRVSVDEMAAALRAQPSPFIDVTTAAAPPAGLRSGLIERALARALRRPATEVRAVWTGMPDRGATRGQSIILIDRRDVLVDARADGFDLRYGDDAQLGSTTALPLFEGAVRLPDGRWRRGLPQDPARKVWTSRILLTYLAGILLFMPLAWAMARRIARPLERLADVAACAAPSDIAPFPLDGPHELAAAGRAMNDMHARLREHAADRIRMLAAVVHDLRTPLTALRLRVNDVGEPLRTRLNGDLVRICAMTDELLDHARTGAAVPSVERVDIVALARSCCEVRAEADDRVRFSAAGQVYLRTDKALLRRAIENLLDNAIRYGGGAAVRVSLVGEIAMIEIEDEGPGIPPDRMAEALKPFARLDPSRSRDHGGTGLGLSIVADIMAALGGRLALTNLDKGLRASIALPV